MQVALHRRLAFMASQREVDSSAQIPSGGATTEFNSAALAGRIWLAAYPGLKPRAKI